MTEGKAASEATSQLHRKYHSYKQIKLSPRPISFYITVYYGHFPDIHFMCCTASYIEYYIHS